MEFVQPGERELPTIAYFLLCKESAKAINVVASPAYSTQLKDPQGQGAGLTHLVSARKHTYLATWATIDLTPVA
eukprot:5435459-Pleurochrysis_carterae.AAC.1